MECAICLNSIRKTRSTLQLRCGHIFHGRCFETWNKTNGTCPLCRRIADTSKFKVNITVENTQTHQSVNEEIGLVDVEDVLNRMNIDFQTNDLSLVEISLQDVEDLRSFLTDIRSNINPSTLYTH